jgi:hypothetical protein
MSTAEMTKGATQASLRLSVNFVGIYYLLTILTGAFVLFFHGRLAFVADLIASVFYLSVTALFYGLSRSRNRSRFLHGRSGVRE